MHRSLITRFLPFSPQQMPNFGIVVQSQIVPESFVQISLLRKKKQQRTGFIFLSTGRFYIRSGALKTFVSSSTSLLFLKKKKF